MTQFTVPGMSNKDGSEVADLLQKALSRYNDLHLTLKHIHWNVVGPQFHRGARDDRPTGRTGPWLRRRGRGADRHAGKVSARHAWRDHQRPHLGRLLGRAGHRAGAPGRTRRRLHRRHRGHAEEHRAGRETSTLSPRTCSSRIRRSWRNSSGSCAPIWRTRAVSWPTGAPRRKRRPPAAPGRRRRSSRTGFLEGVVSDRLAGEFLAPAEQVGISETGDRGADQRRQPEDPQLRGCAVAVEECDAGGPRRVHRRVRDRDRDQVDQGQREPDRQAREAF